MGANELVELLNYVMYSETPLKLFNHWWRVYSSWNFGRMLSVGAIHFEDRQRKVGEAFTGRRALTIVSSLMSGCGRGHDPWETW